MSFLASITNNSSLQSNLKATVLKYKVIITKFMNSEPTECNINIYDYDYFPLSHTHHTSLHFPIFMYNI